MAILKTTAALSLAVLISIGASGCSGSFSIGAGDPTQTPNPQVSSSSEATAKSAVNETEQVRVQAEETLNELNAFSKSEAFTAFYEEMGTIKEDDPETMTKIEAILDKNKPLQDELSAKIGLSPDALRGYQGIFAMSSANMKTPYSEKFINAAILFSALGDIIGGHSSASKDFSFGVTSNAITENAGEYKLSTYGIFIKDSNNAVVEFPDSASATYGLKDGGKKIIIEEVDGEVRDEKKTSSEQLSIDVRDAATTIETWIVYQQGKTIPLTVEDGKIVSGKIDKGNPEFSISDGIKLEFEGNSNSYLITGTSEKTGEKLIYDSANGGLQESKESLSKEEKSSVKYDSKAFQKVRDAYLQEGSKDLKTFVDYLNSSEYTSDATFEVVEKNGVEYIKVSDPDSKIAEKELLYVSPLK